MADEQVQVRFGADTAGVTAGGSEVKGVLASIQGLVAELGAGLKAMGAAAVAGFSEMTEGAEGATASLKEMRDTATEVRESVRGLAETLIAAFAVEQIDEAAKKMGETAEQTQHVADTFGLTTDQVQSLRAEASGLGVSFDAITSALQREDGAMVRAKEGSKQTGVAFRALGIDIKAPIDNATLFQKTIAGLANIEDVPTRIGLAMQLFGRNIQNIGPLIDVTKEQIAEISDATTRYGAVNAGAQAAGLELADAFNLQKIEMQGLGNTLTAELAPDLTALVKDITGLLESFRQWASQGDNLKTALTTITVAAVALASVLGAGLLTSAIEGLVALLSGVFLGAIQLATAGMVEFDIAADANPIGALVLGVEALVAGLVLLYNWLDKTGAISAMVADLGAAWDVVAAAFKVAADAVAPLVELIQASAEWIANVIATGFTTWWADLDGQIQAVLGPLGKFVDTVIHSTFVQAGWKGATDDLKAAFDGLKTSIADISTNIGDFLKANFPDIVQGWDNWVNTLSKDIDQLTAAFQKFLGIAGGAKPPGDDGLPTGLPPLGKHHHHNTNVDLTPTKKGKKDNPVKDDDKELQLAEAWQTVADQVAGIQDNMVSLEVAFWAKKVAAATASSAEWVNAVLKLKSATDQQNSDMIREITKGVDEEIRQHERLTAAIKKETDAQVKEIVRGVELEIKAHKEGIQQERRAYADFSKVVEPMVSSFTSGLLKMAEGTQSFAQTMRNMGEGILNDMLKVIDKMITEWLYGELRKTAASLVGNTQRLASTAATATASAGITRAADQQQVLTDAKVAAANTYKAVSAIPVIGPFLAPEAAAVAFAAVEAFSASGGFDIGNFAPLTQLHPQEMVLPARIANPVRAMAENYNPEASGPWSGAGGGDTHHHYNYTIQALDGASVKRVLEANHTDHAAALESLVRRRNGKGFGAATA